MKINDRDDGANFICDEEPYVLGPMDGDGYNPHWLDDDKFEVVRKLGWAGCVAG